ncbi:MAG: DNA alkylation repair protein [Cyclobacteriaceae bacterium]
MAEPLKDRFLQLPFLEAFGASISRVYPDWSQPKFLDHIYTTEWEAMELKERMKQVSLAVGKCLPQDFGQAVEILKAASDGKQSFDGLVYAEFVLHHGQDNPDIALDALEVFTQLGSAEFAIRPFIMKYEDLTMKRMRDWSKHKNVHVRRLASEGCRPRLPWAPALPAFKKDPSPILPILENLKDDPELYVRKSVANNLNDLTKDNADLVLDLLERWNKDPSANTKWIIKQALRGLIKSGNERALAILGYREANAEIKNLSFPKSVTLGDKFKITFDLSNIGKSTTDLMIDYIIYHQKANGKLTPKVFKLSNLKLEPGESKSLTKQHTIKPITTRKYYPGEHQVAIQVNGKILGQKSFELKI